MKKLCVKVAETSYNEMTRIAHKCGFVLFEGNKHCKVKTSDGKFITMIPRHNQINKLTAKNIAEALKKFCGDVEIVRVSKYLSSSDFRVISYLL